APGTQAVPKTIAPADLFPPTGALPEQERIARRLSDGAG
ncbi:MAG: hypothetical protein ACI9W2_002264, partial [Gammaproteobacteria bacterium]